MNKTERQLSKNLVFLRENKHLTQSRVAEDLEISLRRYQKYEYMDSFPKAETLEIIANYYGVSVQDLFSEDIQSVALKKDPGGISVDELVSMITTISSLKGEDLELLRDTLKALSKPIQGKAQKKKEA